MDAGRVIRPLQAKLDEVKADGLDVMLCSTEIIEKVIALLKEYEKEIKALRLLVEWAEECDFGFDQFHNEYERYKNEIKDMKYIDGMIHIAKRTLEDHGAFEEENDNEWKRFNRQND